ncbi:threonine/serine exporter family protein [Sporosarcina sp. ACRSL]|uniref:threonine/serine exporter family protein n=1 Tax=Sporosarcina sp. ACRSL TaxID=2918215 RepID=UPI001EF4BF71|nr:threonine/serine exporter family protein [Sporosarcina sp. ACRSL]MCG7343833.1 threonine/serine exporter family protein [Sporosarcina sp. ACRSL]
MNNSELGELCLLAGKIMLENGAETYRVEDTMMRIAGSFGINNPNSYVTPTGIIFSLCGTEQTKLAQISKRTTDLYKVIIVNSISRKLSTGEISAEEAYSTLRKIEKENLMYPIYVKVIAASILSGFSLIMFNGEWKDFFSAFLAGGAGFLCVSYLHRLVDIKFFTEFVAALIVGLVTHFFKYIGFGLDLSTIIVASIMPLVPGLLITNAVRDLMAGHLVSGLSKGAEAVLTAFAIGAGVAIVFSLFK